MLSLLKCFLSDRQVASICPSSPILVKKLCQMAELSTASRILEFGAGDGVLTRAILRGMKPDAQLISFETNDQLVTLLRRSFHDPRLQIHHESAAAAATLCAEHGFQTDLVISGIPYSFLTDEELLSLCRQTAAALAPTGQLLIYQTWLPPLADTTRLQAALTESFSITSRKRELLNLPPIEIILARPKGAD